MSAISREQEFALGMTTMPQDSPIRRDDARVGFAFLSLSGPDPSFEEDEDV